MKSKDKELAKHVKEVSKSIDLDSFLSRFKLEIGPSYDEITRQACMALEANGIPKGEIDTLAYPNAIQLIAALSVKHDPADRRITKKKFLSDLTAIRTTAISRWTMELKTREKLLQARRKQLKVHLDKNARLRYFVIDPSGIKDYDSDIVLFITDYIDKYHVKRAHINTPILCICANKGEVEDIQRRLYAKGIVATDGCVGGQFEGSFFFREPMVGKVVSGQVKREFNLRIVGWDDHGTVLNDRKCDDLFIIGEAACDALDTTDVNVERLAGATLKEVKYVMGVSNVYE